MAKILVTGGAGFIGSHVVDAYIEAGHQVVVVDSLLTGRRENLNPRAAFHELDIRDKAMGGLFEREQFDVVNHLAAQIDVRRSVNEPLFDADINIGGGIHLLELCRTYGVKRFIFASTGGAIYGEPEELPASENCRPKPECQYATSKLSFEHYVELYHRLYELTYCVLRFPNVYGPRQNPEGEAGVCAILSGLMLQGKAPTLFGHGTPLRDYVYVGDIARANVLALEKGDNRVINLGSGRGTSVMELFEALKGILDFQGEPKLEPLRPGEIQENYITGDLAHELLGWKPAMDLREGLRNTAEHVRKTL